MLIIYLSSISCIACLSYALYKVFTAVEVEQRKVQRVGALLSGERQGIADFSLKNLIKRYANKFVGLVVDKYIKEDIKSSVSNDLYLAGERSKHALIEFYVKRTAFAIGAASVAFLLKMDFFSFLVLSYAGFTFPKIQLDNRKKERQKLIRRSFPLSLDMLVITLEAGYNLEKALSETIENLDKISKKQNKMSEEFKILMNELKLGLDTISAWKNLYKRTQIEEIKELTQSVIQSEKFGSKLASTLRNLSLFLIKRKSQELEAASASTGPKMAFPLILCLLPAIGFLVGPFIEELYSSNIFGASIQ